MSNNSLPEKVYCPKCSRAHEAPVCIPLQRWQNAFLAACLVLYIIVLLVMPTKAQQSPTVPPKPTIGEPVTYPHYVFLPVVTR